MHKGSRSAQKVDYPSFGGVGGPPAPDASVSSKHLSTSGPRAHVSVPPQVGDKTLAQSAQMYHYQHRKQQMLTVGRYVLSLL